MRLDRTMDMTLDGARKMARAALQSVDALNQAVYEAKQTEPEPVFLAYRDAASRAIMVLLEDVLNPVFAKYPELKPDGFR
jgi:hypothetical protein